ncbi:MAG: hypothetical protein RQ761_03535 [Bacteroidales bacterium]|nr:hypothetical protein [Bacteroidales bacterium]
MLKTGFHILILLSFWLASGLAHHAAAQNKDPIRVELNANLDMEDYQLIPCGKNGVFVFFESNQAGKAEDTRRWHFAMYNKHFKQQWVADTALIYGAKFKGYAADAQYTYLFFIDEDKQKSPYNFQVLRLDYDIDSFALINASIPENSEPVGFEIVDEQAVVALNNSSYEPQIAMLDLISGAVKIINPEIEGLNIIQQMFYDDTQRNWYFVVDNYLGKKQNAIIVLKANANGQVIKTFMINTVIENKVLNEARIASTEGDTLLIAGTYHNHAAKLRSTTDEEGIESAGYFFCRFEGETQTLINYYNFLEFEEMYRSLSSKTLAEVRRKAEKQKNKGEEYSLDYTVLLHDVVHYDNEFVIISEAYYPEYRTVTNMYYDYYGRPIPQTYTVFDGFKYISGIVASFNRQGEMNWDNGVELIGILTFNLSKYTGSFVSGDELALFYSNANKVNYKMMGSGREPGSLQNINLEKFYKGDKVMEDLGSRIIHWYNNYFICYGYQTIKNNRISGGKRTIFYFHKLAFN